jgi:dihydroflavonol-4-reductase
MKVFVTGGNGFIGSRVVRQLHAAGHSVRCLVRETSKTHRIDMVPFERHIGDVRDVDSLVAGMNGCDGVIHLASISSWDQIRSPIMRIVVVDGTRNVMEAATRAGGLRTVFVSSCAAINGTKAPEMMNEDTAFTLDPKTYIYAGAKHEAEAICNEFAAAGLPVMTVNPCEVYGPEDEELITASYLLDALKDWPVMSLHGGTAVAHVEDIAAGIIAALDKGRGGERYILGGENLHVREVMEKTLVAGGQGGKTILQLPNCVTKGVIKGLAKLRLPTPVIPDIVDYGTLFWFVDCGKAERELGYTYRSADETIKDVVDWLIAEGLAPAR